MAAAAGAGSGNPNNKPNAAPLVAAIKQLGAKWDDKSEQVLEKAYEAGKKHLNDVSTFDVYGHAPIHAAILVANPNVLNWYVNKVTTSSWSNRHDVEPELKTKNGETPLELAVCYATHARYEADDKKDQKTDSKNTLEPANADHQACLEWVLKQLDQKHAKGVFSFRRITAEDSFSLCAKAFYKAMTYGNLYFVTYFHHLVKTNPSLYEKLPALNLLDRFFQDDKQTYRDNCHTVLEVVKQPTKGGKSAVPVGLAHLSTVASIGRDDLLEGFIKHCIPRPKKLEKSDSAIVSAILYYSNQQNKVNAGEVVLKMIDTLVRVGVTWDLKTLMFAIEKINESQFLIALVERYSLTTQEYLYIVRGKQEIVVPILTCAIYHRRDAFARYLVRLDFVKKEWRVFDEKYRQRVFNEKTIIHESVGHVCRGGSIDLVRDCLAQSIAAITARSNVAREGEIANYVRAVEQRANDDNAKAAILAYVKAFQTILTIDKPDYSELIAQFRMDSDREALRKVVHIVQLLRTRLWLPAVKSKQPSLAIQPSAPALDEKADAKEVHAPPGGIDLPPQASLAVVAKSANTLEGAVQIATPNRYDEKQGLNPPAEAGEDPDAALKRLLAEKQATHGDVLSPGLINSYVAALHTAIAHGNLYYVTYYFDYLVKTYPQIMPVDLYFLDEFSCSDKQACPDNFITLSEILKREKANKKVTLARQEEPWFICYIHSAALLDRKDLLAEFINAGFVLNKEDPKDLKLDQVLFYYGRTQDHAGALRMIEASIQLGAEWRVSDLQLLIDEKVDIDLFRLCFEKYNLYQEKFVRGRYGEATKYTSHSIAEYAVRKSCDKSIDNLIGVDFLKQVSPESLKSILDDSLRVACECLHHYGMKKLLQYCVDHKRYDLTAMNVEALADDMEPDVNDRDYDERFELVDYLFAFEKIAKQASIDPDQLGVSEVANLGLLIDGIKKRHQYKAVPDNYPAPSAVAPNVSGIPSQVIVVHAASVAQSAPAATPVPAAAPAQPVPVAQPFALAAERKAPIPRAQSRVAVAPALAAEASVSAVRSTVPALPERKDLMSQAGDPSKRLTSAPARTSVLTGISQHAAAFFSANSNAVIVIKRKIENLRQALENTFSDTAEEDIYADNESGRLEARMVVCKTLAALAVRHPAFLKEVSAIQEWLNEKIRHSQHLSPMSLSDA